MNHTVKMVMVPETSDDVFATPERKTVELKSPEQHKKPAQRKKQQPFSYDTLSRILQVVMKLGLQQAYDEKGQIPTRDGGRTDLLPLLRLSMTAGKKSDYVYDFVSILRRSGVTPDLVVNETMKAMLQDDPSFLPPSASEARHVTRRKPRSGISWDSDG